MSIIKRIYNKCWNIRLEVYLWLRRRRLKNHNFSIISNNCVGGIMSHDLHERFNSPTVNLWFTSDDFFVFTRDLDYFLKADIIETFESGIGYPIGRIYYNEGFITLYFTHYKCFSDAVEKWRERAERVDKNNLFIVFEYPAINDDFDEQEKVKKQFDSIPYKDKIMITKQSDISSENIVHMQLYDSSYYPGKILSRKNKVSVKRYLDDYDYISFLNKSK